MNVSKSFWRCAGAKSILDLPKTMEYLETKGVPVIGYQTNELPALIWNWISNNNTTFKI
jgi:pseudouridine-5'-phosphate glycosidase